MKQLLLLTLLVGTNSLVAQQTGLTETYSINKIGYNPAAAGSENSIRITAIGQYGNINTLGSLKNYYLAAETQLQKSIGIALQYSNYSYNLIDHKAVSISITKHLPIGEKSKLSFGITSGLVNSKLDFTSNYGLTYITKSKNVSETDLQAAQKTPQNNFENFAEKQWLLGVGIYFNAEKWHLGFAIPNAIKNKMPVDLTTGTKTELARPAFLSLERDFELTNKIDLKAGSLYRFTNNIYQKGLDINANIWLNKKYSLGLMYQRIGAENICNGKPILAMAEVIIKKARLAYTFNINNKCNEYTNIQQAVMFRLDIDYIKNKTNP
jgi:type IX secretion system PorP/SprF family membrane protein